MEGEYVRFCGSPLQLNFVDSFAHLIVTIQGSRHEPNLLSDIDARYGTALWTYRS